jgi:hypothetical protein
MKRDMDLIREILLAVEASPDQMTASLPDFEGYTDSEINYHLVLLHEAGLIIALIHESDDQYFAEPVRLTWEGHEFLEAIKDKSKWNETKKIVLEKSGGLVYEVIRFFAVESMKKQLFP